MPGSLGQVAAGGPRESLQRADVALGEAATGSFVVCMGGFGDLGKRDADHGSHGRVSAPITIQDLLRFKP